ncbi:MAG TPA: 30S ribosomal protein S4 [Methanobacteriaceae archaeon]|nr:30S ribosomal protein S4 [Methanobacteriaceae archaeon]
MGHPRKSRKSYDTPSHPWNADRIKDENRLVSRYGLKNKKEVWKAETMIKRYRRDARVLLGTEGDHNMAEREQLLGRLIRLGILGETAKLEDVLDLTVDDVLRRRLQTMVHKQGLAHTVKQARLMVVHGHIALQERKIDSPSYLVKRGEEELIGFYPGSPMENQIQKPATEAGKKE